MTIKPAHAIQDSRARFVLLVLPVTLELNVIPASLPTLEIDVPSLAPEEGN